MYTHYHLACSRSRCSSTFESNKLLRRQKYSAGYSRGKRGSRRGANNVRLGGPELKRNIISNYVQAPGARDEQFFIPRDNSLAFYKPL